MAGDWIKMRPSLLTSPKVNGMARFLEDSPDVGRALSTGYSGRMSDIVSRNVMRNVIVASLLTVWGAANEHTTDGVFNNADLSDIDDMVGIPGFGDAMVFVGWAVVDAENFCVTLPNFNEYNTCGRDRATEKNAERQRRFREKKRGQAEENNVTNNVTNNDREEKRREEVNTSASPAGFAEFWAAYPRKVGKGAAEKAFRKSKIGAALLPNILQAIERARATEQWRKDGGQFIPHPSTWINERRWEDDADTIPIDGASSPLFAGVE